MCPDQAGPESRDADQNGCPPQKKVRKPDPEPKPKPAPAPVTKGEQGKQAIVHFAGFRRYDDGSSSVIVKLSNPVTVVKSTDGLTLTYTLQNSRVTYRNNRNPLLANYFDSIVESIRLKPAGKDVQLVIVLRRTAKPNHQVLRSGKEAALRIDFPKLSRDVKKD